MSNCIFRIVRGTFIAGYKSAAIIDAAMTTINESLEVSGENCIKVQSIDGLHLEITPLAQSLSTRAAPFDKLSEGEPLRRQVSGWVAPAG